MKINVITNINNGVGLQRCYEIYKQYLPQHEVLGVDFRQLVPIPKADLNIFDEVVEPYFFRFATKQWFSPHPEWWFPEWDQYLFHAERIICKTKDCTEIFKRKHWRADFMGFTSRDLCDDSIPRQPLALHVAGESKLKNTLAVIAAWQYPQNIPLTLLSKIYPTTNPQIHHHSWLELSKLKTLMNSHLFHIIPSAYEGYGHVVWEALSCGNILLVADQTPTADCSPIKVPPIKSFRKCLATCQEISPGGIINKMDYLSFLSGEELSSLRINSRRIWEEGHQHFLNYLKNNLG